MAGSFPRRTRARCLAALIALSMIAATLAAPGVRDGAPRASECRSGLAAHATTDPGTCAGAPLARHPACPVATDNGLAGLRTASGFVSLSAGLDHSISGVYEELFRASHAALEHVVSARAAAPLPPRYRPLAHEHWLWSVPRAGPFRGRHAGSAGITDRA